MSNQALPLPEAEFIDFLHACSAVAAACTLPLFRQSIDIDNKLETGFDPVTEGDRNAEIAIRAKIAEKFPDHSIHGEEFDNVDTDSPWTWVLDPIDGTRAYVTGVPMWGTLIGLMYNGTAIAGLASQPFIGEDFLAVPGQAIYQRNGNSIPLTTATTTELSQATLFTTTPALFEGAERAAYDALEASVRLPRYGCDWYAYALLAGGHIDLVVETALKDVDITALIPVIREAGGIITGLNGKAPEEGGFVIAAATEQLHAAALEIIQKKL